MQLSLICAMSENRVIGRENDLPWRLSEDLKYFKRTTMGCCIIMGRKTWESLGRPLPGRSNIVISANPDYRAEGAELVHSLEEALALAATISADSGKEEAFVIGGAAIYREALPLAQRIHLTRVHATVAGDTYLDEFDEDDWQELAREDYSRDENNEYDFSICLLQRKPGGAADSQ